ncbi:hypothetical protein [Lysobacter gummosus]|uniref:DUF4124 domain-containing protein n=1 Tax=Lysobacter gummosus TaxID=262324 RepID=A0ABY3XG49_9GAMM|nr:hypothetical protein [Lysobacter gummosus]ALN90034.1 hypothetical protein LG3211_1058 [Lysobacter gummosus]UNP30609.1 hypothetical protein MOV92_04910 [Lysobacter gummosus]
MPSFARLCLSLLPPLALTAMALHPGAAQAQIRRCTDTRGNSVYTDRDCATVGGVDRLPRGAAQAQPPAYTGGCARNLRDLVGQITHAIDAHDGNKLASVYHWAGMSDAQAYSVIERLDAIAQRPLLDIAPVMPSAPVAAPAAGEWTTLPPAAPNAALTPLPPATSAPPPATGLGRPAGMDAEAAPPEAAVQSEAAAPVAQRRAPVALRLEQTLGNGITPSRTVFGLTRHFGCWWIKG